MPIPKVFPKNKMKICFHWTVGTYKLSVADFRAYHYTYGEKGNRDPGLFPIEANVPPLKTSQYAMHCGGGNSHCVGLAARGMHGYVNPSLVGPFPITRKQVETMCHDAAVLLHGNGYKVATPDNCFTHYEWGKRHPETSSRGKIDIICLPYLKSVNAANAGNFLRNKVQWYLNRIIQGIDDDKLL